jgi:hypothetical protein
MRTKADQYRERAGECEAKAAQARDLQAKQIFTEAANEWRELARQMDSFASWRSDHNVN